MRKENGFSMMEMMVTTIIIGILATVSIGYYIGSKENVANREAASSLLNIQVAERSYFLDHNVYYPDPAANEANIGNINANLKLSLPTAANRNWDYTVFSTGCARATRNGGDVRSWFLTITDGVTVGDGQPDAGAGCP